MRLLLGTTYSGSWDSWYGPSGRGYSYNITLIANSPAGLALRSLGRLASTAQIEELRLQADVKCSTLPSVECKPLQSPCLFNVLQDPCETSNLADQ